MSPKTRLHVLPQPVDKLGDLPLRGHLDAGQLELDVAVVEPEVGARLKPVETRSERERKKNLPGLV